MNDNLPVKPATIADAPKFLNTNDKAFWVAGWNDCADEIKKARAAIEHQSVPAGWYITKAEAVADAEEQAMLAAAPQPQPVQADRKELLELAEMCFQAGIRHGQGAKNGWFSDGKALALIDRIVKGEKQ